MPGNNDLFILDDDPQYAELLVEIAQDHGWQVEHSTDPIAFLERSLSEETILVLDLILPDVDGIEVIRALAERRCYCPLILISGFDNKVLHSAQQLAEAHNMPVIATLTKPFDIGSFITLLDQIKSGHAKKKNSPVRSEVTFSEKDLIQALDREQFILHYQPQVSIKTGEVTSIEALVRWLHPHKGLIYPDKFIYQIEEFKLINQLTSYVLRLACEDLRQLKTQHPFIKLSVNVTADNIVSLVFPELLKNITDQNNINPTSITLELTESAVMGHLTSSLDVLNRLRMKGFKLSIDDFGTGYSSLQQLYQAPFTELKIDRAFTSKMLVDNEAMAIVKICIMLGKMLNMKTLAEGVETKEIMEELDRLSCDYAQGYYIAKPMPYSDLMDWIPNALQQLKQQY
ncbi:EAL domain-containing response regulator [Thalassotalea marina]|uniref:Signal transduction protein n=1 Tax=Thalassotalea marina TaxID=1673741 RepID=A0A919BC22_9GAMM|nr:EAL domain-containing response regulator [Thalassotalea marina]GHF81672.1 signal transduction protein [Thalassotalea marina]